MRVKRLIRHLLLAFVWVSLGFALGKEVTLRRQGGAAGTGAAGGTGETIVVTYLRSTFRCVTCNLVEEQTDALLRAEHAGELADGRMEYRVVDFIENRELAARYKVSGNLVVVSRFAGGEEVNTVRLDRVLDLAADADAFADYLRRGIAEARGEPAL